MHSCAKLSDDVPLAAVTTGGAVTIYNADVGQHTFSQVFISSNFSNHSAVNGAAVAISPFQANLMFLDSHFTHNIASSPEPKTHIGQGGGVSIIPDAITRSSNSSLSLMRTTFTDNKADLGGGLGVAGVSNMSMQSVVFSNNNATGTGGGLTIESICTSPGVTLNSDDAFQLPQRACSITITDSVFTDNTAWNAAGAYIQADGYESSWVNTNFTNNQALFMAGGLVYNQVIDNNIGSVVLMADMLFRNNSITGSTTNHISLPGDVAGAGGFWADALLCLAIVRSTFDSNNGRARFNFTGFTAGAMAVSRLEGAPDVCYLQSQHALSHALTLTPHLFNPGPNFNVYSTSTYTPSAMDLRSNKFTSNEGNDAGAIYIHHSNINNMTIANSNFSDNASGDVGGSISASSPPDIYILSCFFRNESASTDGGAFWVADARLVIKGASIQSCYAFTSGGAISATSGSTVAVYDSDISSNWAGLQGGGAVSCVACELAVFNNTSFEDNTSLDVGGVLRADADTKAVAMQYVQASRNRQVSLSWQIAMSGVWQSELSHVHAVAPAHNAQTADCCACAQSTTALQPQSP